MEPERNSRVILFLEGESSLDVSGRQLNRERV